MSRTIPRSAGCLLHPTSLPGGRLGAPAERFADFLVEAGFGVWQMLPVGTVDAHGSPYQPDSAFAGHAGLFEPSGPPTPAQLRAFTEDNADWLPDYALFAALKSRYPQGSWRAWPEGLRRREPAALVQARRALAGPIATVTQAQCGFERDWSAFKRRLNDRGLAIFGDVPLFLAHDSADVWAQRQLFEIGDDDECEAFMGVPPDAFSDEGQWWGYAPYRWDAMAAENYRWWVRRFEVQARRFDWVRIDHFRGLCGFWRIPRGARSAREGAWVPGPGRACLEPLAAVMGRARLVAEDLGYITEDVVQTRRALQIPGMRVLQFAFDGDPDNPHLPARHEADSFCYTGTHDNDTTLGWWRALDAATRQRVCDFLGTAEPAMPQALVETAWRSPAPMAIVPMQDLLGLPGTARMNTPGVTLGNWQWRFDWSQLAGGLARTTRQALQRNDRCHG